MGECRGGGDCLIKLFGKTIPVTEAADAKDVQHTGNSSSSSSTEPDAKGNNRHQDTLDPPPQPEVVDPEDPENSQHPGGDGEASHRGKLKKPDKVLPCPRCDSTDTKFCYFNNYNVNQPRHFCKNCQRYWTAGGAMRNVPVGAGRRKNKGAVAAASHFIHRVRAALPAAAGDPLRRTASGAVLSFGHGDDLEEQRVDHMKKERLLLPIGNAGDRQSARPCSVGSSNRDDKNPSGIVREKVTVDKPANEAQQHPANMNGGATMWPYSRAPSQAHYPPGVAVPTTYYPATPGYWVCMVPGGWSLPWPVQSPTQGLLSSLTSVSSGADSLTLGKHAREGDEEGRSHGSGRVWTPKTIRIDDVDEVAKSSVWSLIGVKGDKQNADTDGRRHGTVFEPKHDAKTAKQATIASSPLQLHANPVALTRSLTFQEGS